MESLTTLEDAFAYLKVEYLKLREGASTAATVADERLWEAKFYEPFVVSVHGREVPFFLHEVPRLRDCVRLKNLTLEQVFALPPARELIKMLLETELSQKGYELSFHFEEGGYINSSVNHKVLQNLYAYQGSAFSLVDLIQWVREAEEDKGHPERFMKKNQGLRYLSFSNLMELLRLGHQYLSEFIIKEVIVAAFSTIEFSDLWKLRQVIISCKIDDNDIVSKEMEKRFKEWFAQRFAVDPANQDLLLWANRRYNLNAFIVK